MKMGTVIGENPKTRLQAEFSLFDLKRTCPLQDEMTLEETLEGRKLR